MRSCVPLEKAAQKKGICCLEKAARKESCTTTWPVNHHSQVEQRWPRRSIGWCPSRAWAATSRCVRDVVNGLKISRNVWRASPSSSHKTPHSGHLVHVHAGGLSPRVETLGDVMGSLRTNRSPEHDSDSLWSRSSCSPHSVASTLPERSRSVMGTLNF